jgi:hypothetical protein
MKHRSAHVTMGGWLLLCLLLCFTHAAKAQQICPAYPRDMYQVYACVEGLTFEQKSILHNPVRFVFPTMPTDITLHFATMPKTTSPA